MGLGRAADGLMSLFGATGPRARAGALLLAAVLISHRPDIAELVLDDGGSNG